MHQYQSNRNLSTILPTSRVAKLGIFSFSLFVNEIANFLEKTSEIWTALINGVFLIISIKIGSDVAEKWIQIKNISSNSNQNLNNNNIKQEINIPVTVNPPSISVDPNLIQSQEDVKAKEILTK